MTTVIPKLLGVVIYASIVLLCTLIGAFAGAKYSVENVQREQVIQSLYLTHIINIVIGGMIGFAITLLPPVFYISLILCNYKQDTSANVIVDVPIINEKSPLVSTVHDQ